MFHLTANAATQILLAAAAQPDSTPTDAAPASPPNLRVAAKIEEDELVYGMGFDDQRENDKVIEVAGVNILIAPRSLELLTGATLDFVELKPGEFQFIFIHPNAALASDCASCSSDSN